LSEPASLQSLTWKLSHACLSISYTKRNCEWLIKRLNKGGVLFSLEDRTISLLIKRRNEFFEENDYPVDDDFELLSALFFEQAYPHRGAEELQAQDFLLD